MVHLEHVGDRHTYSHNLLNDDCVMEQAVSDEYCRSLADFWSSICKQVPKPAPRLQPKAN